MIQSAIRQLEELRKALEAAESDRRLLNALMENVPAGITIADAPDVKVRMVSKYGREILGGAHKGITAVEVAQRWKVYEADGVTPMPDDELPLVRAVKYGEDIRDKEIVQVNEQGVALTLLCNAAPIRNEAGEIVAGVVAWVDITERKRTDEALKTERELLEAVVNHMPAAVALVRGSDLRIQLVNPAYQVIARDTQMVGKTPNEVWPESGHDFDEICRQVLATGEPYHVEDQLSMIRRYPGAPLEAAYFSWSLYRVRLPGNEGLGLLNTTWETSARKKAEDALRESEVRFRVMADGLPTLIWVTDAQGDIQMVNRAYREFFGVTEEDVRGKNWTMLVYPEDQPTYVGGFLESLRERKPFDAEARVLRADGEWRWIHSYGACRFSESGEFLGIVGTSPDVTEQKRAETRLHQALEREENFSRLLQRALLPETPVVSPGYDAGFAYIPAYRSREIGGDFYDVFRTAAGKTGILIGDVAGKGVEAASLAAATRSTIRAFAYEGSSPGEALCHTNNVMMAQGEESGKFVTLLLVILDPETGNIRYSNAGHPPAAICRRDGCVEFLEGPNMPVGIIKDFPFQEGEAHVGSSETVVLYTDGVTEARHGVDMFGVEGIADALIQVGDRSPMNLIGTLLTAVREWADGQLRDDTAIVAVQRLG